MRITRISVAGLFGIFNHTIPMNVDDRITIIHGPNGFGKTALLRMVNALFNGRYFELRSIPFESFGVELDDDSTLRVTKVAGQGREKRNLKVLHFAYTKPGSAQKEYDLHPAHLAKELHFPLSAMEHEIPGLERLAHDTWRYLPTSDTLYLADLIERFSDLIPFRDALSEGGPPEPDWLKEIKGSMRVSFIGAQRLLGPLAPRRSRDFGEVSSMRPAVEIYSEELSAAIKSKLAEYAELSQSLDRTFPARLVERRMAPELTNAELRDRLTELEVQRSRLMEAGLLDKEAGLVFEVPPKIDEQTRAVLSVYVTDVDKKLGVFDELAKKIDLFAKIVGQRFSYKRMSINKENGFKFTTFDGDPLPLASLSSGEQHELVLFYELLFKLQPNSLILIDEPELSLHVAWQVQFLNDLHEIIELAHFDALLATHSPQIINERWDVTVQLKGPSG